MVPVYAFYYSDLLFFKTVAIFILISILFGRVPKAGLFVTSPRPIPLTLHWSVGFSLLSLTRALFFICIFLFHQQRNKLRYYKMCRSYRTQHPVCHSDEGGISLCDSSFVGMTKSHFMFSFSLSAQITNPRYRYCYFVLDAINRVSTLYIVAVETRGL